MQYLFAHKGAATRLLLPKCLSVIRSKYMYRLSVMLFFDTTVVWHTKISFYHLSPCKKSSFCVNLFFLKESDIFSGNTTCCLCARMAKSQETEDKQEEEEQW